MKMSKHNANHPGMINTAFCLGVMGYKAKPRAWYKAAALWCKEQEKDIIGAAVVVVSYLICAVPMTAFFWALIMLTFS